MHSATQQQQSFFLKDAFAQLDAVLQRKREACELGQPADAELRRSQQASAERVPAAPAACLAPRLPCFSHCPRRRHAPTVPPQVIQRWLVIFARQHLYAICNKLMEVAVEADAAAEAAAAEKPGRRRKQLLPSLSKADDDDDLEATNNGYQSEAEYVDTESYFVLDCLRRVLSAAADVPGSRGESGQRGEGGLGGFDGLEHSTTGARGFASGSAEGGGGARIDSPGPGNLGSGDALAPLRGAPDGLLGFCYGRVHVEQVAPIRAVACECVGILSLVSLKPLVSLLTEGIAKVSSDRDEREWVAYQRAARLIHLSTHSAEQAGASLRYLKAVAAAMSRTSRGVLRLEVCRSLAQSLARLMAPADESAAQEWGEYCAGASAAEWWSAYAAVYGHAARWAGRKAAHAPFCFELMARMLSLASRAHSGRDGAAFASHARHAQLLGLLWGALRREAQRLAVLPIAAEYLSALPSAFVADDLADPHPCAPAPLSPLGPPRLTDSLASFSRLGGAPGESQLRALLGAMLPRRAALGPKEASHVQAALLALGRQPAGGSSLLAILRDGLRDAGTPLPTRALLLRVLATLADERPALVESARESLWPLALPPLQAAAAAAAAASAMLTPASGGVVPSAAGEPAGAAEREFLSAALLCLPALWPLAESTAGAERARGGEGASPYEAQLRAVASLVRCEARELCYHASLCLRALIARRPAELAAPVLLAVGRMLLACDGGAPSELQRALGIAYVLTAFAVDTLLELDPATAIKPKPKPKRGKEEPEAAAADGGEPAPALVVVGRVSEVDGSPSGAEWQVLREVMQAVCLACSYHSLPEVCVQAAELLATLDRPRALAWRPPPPGRIALLEALPPGWGDGGGGGGGTAKALEAALCAGGDGAPAACAALGASVPLAWAALWRQAAAGPRPLPPGAATSAAADDGLLLWRRHLRFLALYARHPPPAPARVAAVASPVTAGAAAGGAEVEAFVRRLVWWLLHGPPERASAVLEALRLAHTALLPEAVRQLRALATERAEAPARGGALSLFGGGSKGPPGGGGGADGLPAVFFDARVLRMLAEAYGRVPTAELARADAPGAALLRTTLEQLCSIWLRERHSADSQPAASPAPTSHHGLGFHSSHAGHGSGAAAGARVEPRTLGHAAALLGAYFKLIAHRARERERAAASDALESNTPLDLGGEAAALALAAPAPSPAAPAPAPSPASSGYSSSSSSLSPSGALASLSFVRNALELLQSWMALACSPLALAAAGKSTVTSAKTNGLAPSDARVAVLGALEALLAVRPLGDGAPLPVEAELERGLESDVRRFLDGLLLSAPVLAPPVRRALAAHLRHNGGRGGEGLALFMRKSLRGAHRSADRGAARAATRAAGGGAGVDAGAAALARAYFAAIVDCADGSGEGGYDGGLAAARRADARIGAQLLLLALLHQGAEDAPMRELGARLARAICPLSDAARAAAPHAAPPHAAIAGGAAPLEPLLYAASAFRYSSALAAAAGSHATLPALLSVLVERFSQLSLAEREDALLLLLPWLQVFGTRVPRAAAEPAGPAALHAALASLLAVTRLCSAAAGQAVIGETAQVRFLLEAVWAALATPANAPLLATTLHSILLGAHVSAAAQIPADAPEQALCVRVLLLTLRTPAAPALLGELLGSLRAYGPSAPPTPAKAEWLAWRAPRLSTARPLTAAELSAFEMLPALPHELPALLQPHLPALLHTCVVCHGGEPGTAPAGGRAAQHAVELLDALLANLAPTAAAAGARRGAIAGGLITLSARGLPRGLAAVRPLVSRLGSVAPTLAADWRALALCWAVHGEDPDLSLTSLRVFALLNSQVSPSLLHTLALTLWGALRDGGRAKAQLLLRLMRELPPLAPVAEPLAEETWLLLAETAAALLAARPAHLFEEAARLLLATLAAQGEAGPSERMLERLSAVWRSANCGPCGAELEPALLPLEEVLSRLLLKGLAGEHASAPCRATALLALETLAEDYADLMPPNNRLVVAVLFSHTLAVMLGQSDAAPRAAAFLERCGSALAERLLDLFRSTTLPRAVALELRAAMGHAAADLGVKPNAAAGAAAAADAGAADAAVADVAGAFARAFAERFFGAFALAFSSHDNCDFALLLLSSWLAAESPWDDLRPGGTARATREVALLWMLQALLSQFAPHDVKPAQFEALAPLVVAAFHSRRAPVSAAAEALLSEMVARAPRGTPPSIFALTSARPDPPPPPWCGPLIAAGDAAGKASLLESASLLQARALGVSQADGPAPLPDEAQPALAAVAQLPAESEAVAVVTEERSEAEDRGSYERPCSPFLPPLSATRSSLSSLSASSLPNTPRSRLAIAAPSPSATDDSTPASPASAAGAATPHHPQPAAVCEEDEDDDDSEIDLSSSSDDGDDAPSRRSE